MGALAALVVAAPAMFLAGCASTDTVKKARGEGSKRLYREDQKVVHAAVLAVARERQFTVVENTPASLAFSTGLSWRSFGENIAVFLRTISPRLTEVEVISKPVVSAWNFPRDWEIALLEEIGRSLQAAAPTPAPASAPTPAPTPTPTPPSPPAASKSPASSGAAASPAPRR